MSKYHILPNLEESYFLNPPPLDKYQQHNEWNEYKKKQLYAAYDDARQLKGQCGFSKSEYAEFLKFIVVRHYDRGGHAILPTYILSHEHKGIYTLENPKFKHLHENHNFECSYEGYKRLKQLTYNHVLPDGRIVEYIFDQNNHFKINHESDMFHEVNELRKIILLNDQLENSLPQKESTSSKKMKI